jgi:two-component system, OmpR family, response regulator
MNREAKKKIKILVVDQDQDFLERARRNLSKEGFRVKSTDNYDGVLEEYRSDRFQIIIIDITMDNNSGLSLLQELRKVDDDIGVIVMANNQNLDDAIKILRAGAIDYCSKDLDSEELLEVINQAIRRKGLVVDFEKKINLEIGRKIRSLRQERGLTLQQLANRTGLSISLISQVERAKSSSSVSTLYKIATALNVRLEYFFNGI